MFGNVVWVSEWGELSLLGFEVDGCETHICLGVGGMKQHPYVYVTNIDSMSPF